MKIVLSSKKALCESAKLDPKSERHAALHITRNSRSMAYRRAVATSVPVTYISGGKIIRLSKGSETVIGSVARGK